MLNSNVTSSALTDVVNGTSSATVGPNVVGNTQESDATVRVVAGVAIVLLLMLYCIVYIVRHKEHRIQGSRRNIQRSRRVNNLPDNPGPDVPNVIMEHLNYLREHGPGPDVPNVIMELDVVHNAQSRENQSQYVESSPFICNHDGQENGKTSDNHKVRPAFRLQGMFPR
ncbi:hypothetical protein [Ehrlichia muris]|uniref:Uncharacterized protein n=1 Tax=Ehrlichia muris AS145 TaxID=1423892 RepID=V9R7G4_9RICK|nr:hypothetical protein [Ehrlichia muris]AHC39757.1 hypothetical protein EMUR_03900 [Ehrlichia muris AS145]